MDPRHMADLCSADNSILLVIDLQGKIFTMAFNHEALGAAADKLLRLADLFSVPVVLTEQYPRGLGTTDADLRRVFDGLTTDKHLVEKNHFGCCGEAGFDALIADLARGVRDARADDAPDRPVDVVVCGIESHVCVQQTVLELVRQEYRVVVLQDCTGGRIEACHQIALDRFRQCGAIVSCFESLAFEWTRTKDDERFKAMSRLIR